MATTRGNGSDSAGTRKALLDAAHEIMRAEGYAAVSSRRVAEVAGLKSQLVHYHFGTMDNLFLALFRRTEEEFLAKQMRAITAADSVRKLWELSLDTDTESIVEFIALAVHRKSIGDELARANERTRTIHTAAIASALERCSIDKSDVPPEVLAFLMAAISRTIVTEEALGATAVHPAVRAFVERQIDRLTPEQDRPRSPILDHRAQSPL
jgi:AcrR family transcriptional regulator